MEDKIYVLCKDKNDGYHLLAESEFMKFGEGLLVLKIGSRKECLYQKGRVWNSKDTNSSNDIVTEHSDITYYVLLENNRYILSSTRYSSLKEYNKVFFEGTKNECKAFIKGVKCGRIKTSYDIEVSKNEKKIWTVVLDEIGKFEITLDKSRGFEVFTGTVRECSDFISRAGEIRLPIYKAILVAKESNLPIELDSFRISDIRNMKKCLGGMEYNSNDEKNSKLISFLIKFNL